MSLERAEALRKGNYQQRAQAVAAVGEWAQTNREEGVALLQQAYGNERSQWVRLEYQVTLYRLGDEAQLYQMLLSLQSTRSALRMRAVELLRSVLCAENRERICHAMRLMAKKDPQPEIRTAAQEILETAGQNA